MSSTANPLDPIAALAPLKVLIVAQKLVTSGTDERIPYFTAISRAFQGGVTESPDGSEKYYASGEELGIDVRRIIWESLGENPPPNVEKILESCGHLLVIVLLEGALTSDSDFGRWLNEVAKLALSGPLESRIGILPIVLATQAEYLSLGQFDEFQRVPIGELGEPALRAGHLGLLVLQQAWGLLGSNAYEPLRLFVSHAKRDGTPVALSLRGQIESLRWMRRFYDAQDILPGAQWRRVLRNGVESSVLVVLRTDIYEQRPWCIQEIEWAEEFGTPAVVVEARHSLTMPPELLPIAGLSTVRIHDGNLLRVLNSALREAVRSRLFRRTVELLERANVLPAGRTLMVARPTLSALGTACETRLKSASKTEEVDVVAIPEPFRESQRPIAERLVRAYFPAAILGTPRDFVARHHSVVSPAD